MNVIFVKSASETTHGVVLPDGRIACLEDKNGKWLGFRYDTTFNLETGEILPDTEPDGKQLVTMNLLAQQQGKRLETVQCYREYDLNFHPEYPKTLPQKRINQILRDFRQHGFNVTEIAVKHQFDCWRSGFKSGYRDERHGYHLFTPCGANPFCLRATELYEGCRDWQQTYCA